MLTSNDEEITVRNESSLAQILLCQDVRNLPVLVFSISGKTRGGKSLLLNLMIKYLESVTHSPVSNLDNNYYKLYILCLFKIKINGKKLCSLVAVILFYYYTVQPTENDLVIQENANKYPCFIIIICNNYRNLNAYNP